MQYATIRLIFPTYATYPHRFPVYATIASICPEYAITSHRRPGYAKDLY